MPKRMKRSLALSLCFVMLALPALAGTSPTPLSDIGGHWAEDDIRSAVASGWVNGYPDGTFQPDRTVSRGEFLKLLVMVKGLPTEAPVIADPRLKSLYGQNADQANWVGQSGYLEAGLSAHLVEPADYGFAYNTAGKVESWSLRPDEPLTRLEAAIFVTRAMGRQYEAESFWIDSAKGQNPLVPKPEVKFTDVESIPLWALGWVKVASDEGMLQGFPDGGFHGDLHLNRAQAVTLMRRLAAWAPKPGNVTRTFGQGVGEREHDLQSLANRDLVSFKQITFAPLKGYSWLQVFSAFHRLPLADKEQLLRDLTLAHWQAVQERDARPAIVRKVHVQLMMEGNLLASGSYDGTHFEYNEGHFDPDRLESYPELEARLLGSVIDDPNDRELQEFEARKAEVAKNLATLNQLSMPRSYRFPFQYMGDVLALSDAELSAWGLAEAKQYWAYVEPLVKRHGGQLRAVSLLLRPREITSETYHEYLGLQVDQTLEANPIAELVYDGQTITVKRPASLEAWAARLTPIYFRMGGDGAVFDWHQPVPEAAAAFMETYVTTLGGQPVAGDLPLVRLEPTISSMPGPEKLLWQRVDSRLALVLANPFPEQDMRVTRLLRSGSELVVVAAPKGAARTRAVEAIAAPDDPFSTCVIVDTEGKELYREALPPRP